MIKTVCPLTIIAYTDAKAMKIVAVLRFVFRRIRLVKASTNVVGITVATGTLKKA
jgi:hypothetical protein